MDANFPAPTTRETTTGAPYLQQFFHVSTYLLIAIGVAMIALAEQLSAPVILLWGVPFGCSFSARISRRLQLSSRQAGVCTWLYIPFFLADMLILSGSFVPATLHLILYVLVVKIYQPKANRDYFQLLLLSFLLVLAASSLTISAFFFPFFLAYVLIGLAALISFEIKRSLEVPNVAVPGKTILQPSPHACGPVGQFGLATQKLALRAIVGFSVVCLFSILAVGAAIFFALPRVGAGYFHRSAGKKLALSGFSDRIRLGVIGAIQLDPSVVMRVKASGDPAVFRGARWRGVTLDYFDGRTWSKRVRGPVQEYWQGQQFSIQPGPVGSNRIHYQVLLEPVLTNYLFTLDRIVWLGGNLNPVRHDASDDSITATMHLTRRLNYHAVSAVPSGRKEQASPTPLIGVAKAAYLQLPKLEERVAQLASLAADGQASMPECARKLESYLQTEYTYSLDPLLIEQPQPLTAFLFERRRGHCEYFASAMTILLRELGVPARLVNGFRGGEYNAVGEDYVIRGKDAHSWVEAFDPEQGWLPFDPTPPAPDAPEPLPLVGALQDYVDAFELFWGEWILGYDDLTQISLFRDLQEHSNQWASRTQHQFHRAVGLFQSWLARVARQEFSFRSAGRLPILAGLALVVLLGALAWAARWIYPRLRYQYALRTGDATIAVDFYREMVNLLRSKGRVKPASWTPMEFAASIEHLAIKPVVTELTEIYNEVRFGPPPVARSRIEAAHRLCARLKVECHKLEALT